MTRKRKRRLKLQGAPIVAHRCSRAGCRKRARLEVAPGNDSQKCPACGQWSMIVDAYRLKCRRAGTGKDHPPRCDCHGAKSKRDEKIVYNDGVRIIRGPHRKGQAGCIHHPEFGISENEPPPGYWDFLNDDNANNSGVENAPF